MSKTGAYVAPNVSVDAVIFQLIDNDLSVLLIRRASDPFKGMWALPGGYNPSGETTTEATSRVLHTKAGIDTQQLELIEQLYTADTIARDPRGHCISVIYMGLGKNLIPKASKNTENPQFFPVESLPTLAYDHMDIVVKARERLKHRLQETNAAYALLPTLFTLTQLQTAYEAVLGHLIDKRNFRKKYLSFDLLQPTDEYYQEGAHRPARLYKYKDQTLAYLIRDFD